MGGFSKAYNGFVKGMLPELRGALGLGEEATHTQVNKALNGHFGSRPNFDQLEDLVRNSAPRQAAPVMPTQQAPIMPRFGGSAPDIASPYRSPVAPRPLSDVYNPSQMNFGKRGGGGSPYPLRNNRQIEAEITNNAETMRRNNEYIMSGAGSKTRPVAPDGRPSGFKAWSQGASERHGGATRPANPMMGPSYPEGVRQAREGTPMSNARYLGGSFFKGIIAGPSERNLFNDGVVRSMVRHAAAPVAGGVAGGIMGFTGSQLFPNQIGYEGTLGGVTKGALYGVGMGLLKHGLPELTKAVNVMNGAGNYSMLKSATNFVQKAADRPVMLGAFATAGAFANNAEFNFTRPINAVDHA